MKVGAMPSTGVSSRDRDFHWCSRGHAAASKSMWPCFCQVTGMLWISAITARIRPYDERPWQTRTRTRSSKFESFNQNCVEWSSKSSPWSMCASSQRLPVSTAGSLRVRSALHCILPVLCTPVLGLAQYRTFPLAHTTGWEKEDCGLCGPPRGAEQCRKVARGSTSHRFRYSWRGTRRGDKIQWGEWSACALWANNFMPIGNVRKCSSSLCSYGCRVHHCRRETTSNAGTTGCVQFYSIPFPKETTGAALKVIELCEVRLF